MNQIKSDINAESRYEFLNACLSENLEHARHVENERLTFNSIFMAIIAGALAFDNISDTDKPLNIVILLSLQLLLCITISLTERWNEVFDAHIKCTKDAYSKLQKDFFSEEEKEYRYYSFAVNKSFHKKIGTKEMLRLFQFIIGLIVVSIMFMFFKDNIHPESMKYMFLFVASPAITTLVFCCLSIKMLRLSIKHKKK